MTLAAVFSGGMWTWLLIGAALILLVWYLRK